jgi:chromosome segregation ATPase
LTDLKETIDSVEEKNQNQAKLEKRIEFLKNTISRLKFTIREQKKLVKELKESENAKENLPNDIKILKDLVSSQREDLKSKDETISRLESELNQTKSELAKKEERLEQSIKKERFLEQKERIRALVKEKEKLQNEIKSLQSRLEKFEQDTSREDLNEKLARANKKIEQLRQKNENFRAQIKYLQQKVDNFNNNQKTQSELNDKVNRLKTQLAQKRQVRDNLTNKVNTLQEELNRAKAKIKRYEQEREDLVGQVNYFQEELEKLKNKKLQEWDKNDLMEDIYSQFTQERGFINEKITNYEQEILELENLVEKKDENLRELREKIQDSEDLQKTQKHTEKPIVEDKTKDLQSDIVESINSGEISGGKKLTLNVKNVPQYYQKGLIEYMFEIMNANNKQDVIDFLIQNLDAENPQIRRFTVKILSKIKTNKVFNALIDNISDNDWLVRYYLVKALKSFPEFDGVKRVLREYLNDKDVDVREAAKEALQEL